MIYIIFYYLFIVLLYCIMKIDFISFYVYIYIYFFCINNYTLFSKYFLLYMYLGYYQKCMHFMYIFYYFWGVLTDISLYINFYFSGLK